MRSIQLILSVVIGLTVLTLSGCPKPPPGPPPEPEQVMEVTEVVLTPLKEQSGGLEIVARGNVPTAGWENPHLRPRLYDYMPPDGIFDYDFLATPPDGPAPDVITPVKATFPLKALPIGMKGVRIHAKRNKKVAYISGEYAYFEFRGSGPDELFAILLIDEDKIRHAREILKGADVARRHISGTIVKEKAPYNPRWSYHLAPHTIDFFDVAVETCDASMHRIQKNLDEVGGSFLPNSHWCPWGSELTQELRDIEG